MQLSHSGRREPVPVPASTGSSYHVSRANFFACAAGRAPAGVFLFGPPALCCNDGLHSETQMVNGQSSFRVMDGLTVRAWLRTGQRFRLPSGRIVEVLFTYPEAAQIVASCGYVRTGALRPSNKGALRVSLTQQFLAAHAQPAH